MTGLSEYEIGAFQDVIRGFYAEEGREFPWRSTRDPYAILVSEIMLQQTGTERVLPKYEEFLIRFPRIEDLAAAELAEVYPVWRGLGYNRRAKSLRDTAARIAAERDGIVPADPEILITYPGIGPSTSRSITVFAFNRPQVFIETNIRRVFLHRFFFGRSGVTDREIFPLIEETLDYADPRSWYYGLMDYGVYLRNLLPNPNRRSAHYTVQKPFRGSNREVRGALLEFLSEEGKQSKEAVYDNLSFSPERIDAAARELVAEGLVSVDSRGLYGLGE
ncbi:MAG: A/G-specific adenine glycosylase [Spirochaetia bacterium]